MLTLPSDAVPGPFAGRLRTIAGAGFEAIDLSLTDIAQSGLDPTELSALIADAGLQLASIGPVTAGASKALIASKLELARALNAGCLVVEVASPIGDRLPQPDGTRIALRPDRFHEDATAAYIAQQPDPNIGLALNSLAALGDGSRPARLRDIDGSRLFHVTLVDGPNAPMLPGQGTLNIGGLARVLARAGYCGAWSVDADRPVSALNAYRALTNVLSDAASTEPLLRGAVPDLPQKVPATGIEFIEFAVDARAAKTLEQTLAALAFRPERKHRSKKVTLWRQGAVNIVINEEDAGHAAQARAKHGPCVCDMGLRVRDAAQTVDRARALGAPEFSQSVGLGELDIPAIRGAGGSVIHFIDEQSDLHRVWDIEFEPLPHPTLPAPAGLRRIDHLAQTMAYEDMQSWLLYYLTTFEMTKAPLVNVADPSGIVRSQALMTPEGEVRLNLNGAAGADTLAGSFLSDRSGAGVQHIAFLSDDIFETSSQLAALNFDRLGIPPSYYAETQAAFDLDDAQTDRLRQHDILYDEDESGAYFQLYGQSILNGFFFEIVQRTGRYAGYGARNAPVRLAAQSRNMKGAA